ncbi:MAG: GtrA family protein [Kiritimatiellia bacterium]
MAKTSVGEIRILLGEFLRYVVVGGIAFGVDFGTLVACQEFFFKNYVYGVYIATVFGFCTGLVTNYILSLWFVFIQPKDRGRGRKMSAFAIFGVVGLLGLLWTEIGMWLGIEWLGLNYMIVKVIVTGAVLVWNYLGRKLLIFN